MTDTASIFPGGGIAGETLRGLDWSKTALGPVQSWPTSLKTVVRTMLHTRQATCLFWGPELINLYNDGFIPLLGEKHPAAMGERARDCWRDAWPVVGALLNGVITKGEAVLHEEMLVPIIRQGRLEDAWWNYSYSPAFDDAGDIRGVLVVATETTAEVSVRNQLERMNARESFLRKNAEAANRAKDEFLATVSHELRTPLNAILGWSAILREQCDPTRLEKGLGIIERNGWAQAKIIEDILDVSRIISGKVVLDLSRVVLAAVVQNAIESVRPAATAKQIQLELLLDGARTELIADEGRLQQVVWNLVSNAVKFTPAGGLVRVEASRRNGSVAIVVADTGKGISSEFLPYVFDRFRQDDASTTKRYGGLGLGLAIVRHLVELHGGTVSAKSDGEGFGAIFEVVLPIRAVLPGDYPPAPRDLDSACADAPRLGAVLCGIHVLVVDDEPDARGLLSAVLTDAGATVTEVASVAAAMDELAKGSVSAVVSDIGMPSEDGYMFMDRMRAEGLATRGVPSLALTAYARAEDRERALRAGFREYLAKPVDAATLVRAVADMVRS
jgi:signal transduction histidine kinase